VSRPPIGSLDARAPHAARPSRGELWIVGVVLAAALFARLGRLEWMEMSGDEEFFLVRGFRAIHAGVAYGYPTSAGVRVPPFFVYLVGLPLAFTHDPVVVVAFIALLNVVAVALSYVFARRLLGARSALLVALLMAASPWSIAFSRKIWNLDAIFPLVIAMHAVLASNFERYRRWKVIAAFALYGAVCQVHPSPWLLLPPLVLLHVLLRARIRPLDFALGLAAIGILYAPYIGYLIATKLDNLRYVLDLSSKSRPAKPPLGELALAHVSRPFEIASGTNFHALFDRASAGSFATRPWMRTAEIILWAVFAAMAIAAVDAIVRSIRISRRALAGDALPIADAYCLSFAFALVVPLVACPLLGIAANQHYYIYLYPIVPLLLVWALRRALEALRAPAWSTTAVVSSIAAVQLSVMLAFLAYLPSDEARTSGAARGYYAFDSEAWNARIAQGFDDVLHGDERRRATQADLERRFQACPRLLLHVDATRREPRLEPHGHTRVATTETGIEVRGGSGADMVALPEFPLPAEGGAILRLDVSCEDEALLLVFYPTTSDPEYSHRRVRDAHLARGENRVYVELDARDVAGRLRMRADVYRYVIHSIDVRAPR
jgi:hypothetical protein